MGTIRRSFPDEGSLLKWVAPHLLHITVRFLGSVPQARLSLVEESAAASTAGVRPFALRLSGLGAFPSSRAPRVVWVGLEPGPGLETLQQLARRLETELVSRGFPHEERALSAHVTLARARDGISTADRRKLGEALVLAQGKYRITGGFQVRELVVMRSDLGRNGPTYTPLASLPLADEHRGS